MAFQKAHFASGHDLKQFCQKLGLAITQGSVGAVTKTSENRRLWSTHSVRRACLSRRDPATSYR